MKFERHWSSPSEDVYNSVDWELRTSILKDAEGNEISRIEGVEVPSFWSQLATDILATKYLRKGRETSLKQVVYRIVRKITREGEVAGYFSSPRDEGIFRDELTYMLIHQIGAFNSPVWFNCGLDSYAIQGQGGNWRWDDSAQEAVETTDAYSYPQCSACFIQTAPDDLMGIFDLVKTEARLFKHGSGTGSNFSTLRSKYERISSGGYSSGLMSFLQVFDRAAGATKSGGTCFSPTQKVYTESGPIEIQELAKRPGFLAVSYDPPAKRFKMKKATAWLSGHKEVVKVTTDKGIFEVTPDHPMKLSSGEYRLAGDLEPGNSLFACSVDNQAGYLRLHLKNGFKGKETIHRLVAQDILQEGILGKAVHHKDGNKHNNSPDNLEIMPQEQHASLHAKETVSKGDHVFQTSTWSHKGAANGMHKSGSFFRDSERSQAYSELQGEILKSSGRAAEMQKLAACQKMLNTAFKILNAGFKIDSFEDYISGRKEVIGRIPSITKVRKQIEERFGSYDSFQQEVSNQNHRVISVESLGFSDVYDVSVECPTEDDKTLNSGHNFVIWPDSSPLGSGVVVSNTRRAAKMVCLDVTHPEILDFIQWKQKEEFKARALIAAGYDSDFNGEAYQTISGQNSNNSVRVTDAFMRAVGGQEKYWTLDKSGNPFKVLDSSEVWTAMAEAAWHCADPGVQFHDTINTWNPCKNSGTINASNPCAEFVFLDDTACNLASVNLLKFLSKDGEVFNTVTFAHACRIFLTAQDILVDLSSYPTKEIAENSHKFRPLGLGYCNLGSILMAKGLAYDSFDGRAVARVITEYMTASAYTTSSEIADRLGSFSEYEKNRDCFWDVLKMHSSKDTLWNVLFDKKDLKIRNAQVTVLAPTGTIGLLMDCDTTGIEPDFSLIKYKKLAGGGVLKIVNNCVERALKHLKYPAQDVAKILAYISEKGEAAGCPLLSENHVAIFDCATGTRAIKPDGHLKMMAAVQPFLSGAISKTVNLPHETTVQEIQDLYTRAWQLGLKSVALYRDGCKSSQPLNSSKKELPTAIVEPVHARKRLPSKRSGFTQEARVGGHKIFLRTGQYEDGSLGEIFIDMHKEGAAFRSVMHCFAMAVSMGLQYGVPLETFVKQFTFTRFEPQGLVEGHPNIKLATSLIDYIFRVLGLEYLGKTEEVHLPPRSAEPVPPREEQAVASDAPLCDTCGHGTVRNGTCYRCLNCGNSMGCS